MSGSPSPAIRSRCASHIPGHSTDNSCNCEQAVRDVPGRQVVVRIACEPTALHVSGPDLNADEPQAVDRPGPPEPTQHAAVPLPPSLLRRLVAALGPQSDPVAVPRDQGGTVLAERWPGHSPVAPV